MERPELTQLSDLVLEVRYTYPSLPASYPFLLVSDVHLDNPKCDRKLFFRVMDEAKERGAKILINGDLLCLMQARTDNRGSKSAVRPEHAGDNYFDLVIKDSAALLAPYAENILLIGDGNHETAVTKHKEIDPLDWLVHRLNSDHGGKIQRAGYHSFVKFVFQDRHGGGVRSWMMYRFHGKWGGEVTKGVLGVARQGLTIPDAQCLWSGHSHDLWHVTQPVLKVRSNGETYVQQVDHIRTGTFKDEFNVPGGFGVERIAAPKSMGGYWMTLSVEGSDRTLRPIFEVAR